MGEVTMDVRHLFNVVLRDVVGKHMAAMGERYPNMLVMTADVSTSSRVNEGL